MRWAKKKAVDFSSNECFSNRPVLDVRWRARKMLNRRKRYHFIFVYLVAY